MRTTRAGARLQLINAIKYRIARESSFGQLILNLDDLQFLARNSDKRKAGELQTSINPIRGSTWIVQIGFVEVLFREKVIEPTSRTNRADTIFAQENSRCMVAERTRLPFSVSGLQRVRPL